MDYVRTFPLHGRYRFRIVLGLVQNFFEVSTRPACDILNLFKSSPAKPEKALLRAQKIYRELKAHGIFFVRERGLEPPRDCSHTALNRTRIPVPPLALKYCLIDDAVRLF